MSLNALLAGHQNLTDGSMVPEHIQNAPESVRQRLRALKKLQNQTVDIQSDFYRRVHELETEFRARFDKINQQRAEIVNGNYEPAENECDEKLFFWMDDQQEQAFNEAKPVDSGDNKGPKGIPDFWLHALKNCQSVGDLITEKDEPILSYLTDITIEQTNEPPAFTLKFHFAQNPYFKNSILTKKYTLSIGPNEYETKCLYDGPSIIATEGCKIDWNEGKDITKKVEKKSGKKGGGKPQTRVVPNECFFSFFSPEHTKIEKDMDEDVAEILNADFEAGQMIRDALVDSAILYYTEEAVEDEGDFDFGDEDNEEDEADDEVE